MTRLLSVAVAAFGLVLADREIAAVDAQPESTLDEELLRELGQDVDLVNDHDPLDRIGNRMRSAEERINLGDLSEATHMLQEAIVHDLDDLIKQFQRRRRRSTRGSGKTEQPRRRSQVRTAPKNESKLPAGSPSRPARDASERQGRGGVDKVDMAEMTVLIKEEVWGHLPERTQQQMLQSFGEQFLPKYEIQIEKYFRRLAEGQND